MKRMDEIYGKTVFRRRSVAVITMDCLMHKQKLFFLKHFIIRLKDAVWKPRHFLYPVVKIVLRIYLVLMRIRIRTVKKWK